MVEVEVFGAGEALRRADVRRLCVLATEAAGVREGHLAVEFVDAGRIAMLNAEHRDRQGPTDVLSFPIDGAESLAGLQAVDGASATPADPSGLSSIELGDVVICPEYAADLREAVVHGVLHLMGMDHETDDGEMLELQRRVLAKEGG